MHLDMHHNKRERREQKLLILGGERKECSLTMGRARQETATLWQKKAK